MARFQKTAAVKRFLMIGDSKLVSYDNLTALSGAQVEFIAPLAASATDTAVFAALDPATAERVDYVPVRVADRPTMDRPDYRVLEDTHTLTGKRRSDPPITVRRILVHSAGNALAQAKARVGVRALMQGSVRADVQRSSGVSVRCSGVMGGAWR
ncbi:hypothetical protein [Streptomyces sp. KMM 9044]|uniref:hypothetical protein n=1 Tax=Streptomyces sp. KMM 9044 TaxID=2744474 RepID=UPI0022B24B2B|nr:hypothetical protein [Streptomyces sp. KMM 9044]WAX80210.1 hypothetical protein HUV60_023670 [Streptomyces sp. KMM 9044]